MTREQYLKRAFDLLNSGEISFAVYDSMLLNIDEFVEDDED